MATDHSDIPVQDDDQPLRWTWVVIGVVLGSVLISVFLYFVDRYLDRPAVDGLVVSLCIVLVGILVGATSRGETIREAAVAGLMLAVLTAVSVAFFLKIPIPVLVWLLGPFYAMILALLGGYVGEMLQGTLEEAHVDKKLDWPWVFVSVVIGFTVSSYALFLARSLTVMSPNQDLFVFGAAFLVTGLVVGFFSPGITMIEPAIAAAGMIIVHSGFIVLYFETPPALETLLLAFTAGTLLALAGGWLGETLQKRLRKG
jgi:hypothetical protein